MASQQTSNSDKGLWRDLVAFWILGLCNNFGYVVMLTCAHDIIAALEGDDKHDTISTYDESSSEKRECNMVSTGAVLLADIIPALIVKYIAPFLPFYPFVRVAICVLLATGSFVMVAYGEVLWLALFGVALTSLSSGLGEITFLGYSARYNKNVISTWSSGTGGAGVLGALSYSVLTQIGLTPRTTLLVMICVPVLEAIVFYAFLRHPGDTIALQDTKDNRDTDLDKSEPSLDNSSTALAPDERPLIGFKEQISYIPTLFKFIIPLTLVYLFEYFINQGLYELIYFPNIWLTSKEQYRWMQVDYQLGVFVSRSSVNLIKIKHLWLLSIFQGINVVLFVLEAIFYVSPSIWIVFLFIFWEGLLGGGAYVNTFYRITEEVPINRKVFALSVTAISDSTGIALAGFLSMPAHNGICKLPLPSRLK